MSGDADELQELFADGLEPDEPLPRRDVHVRALAAEQAGRLAYIFVVWSLPASPRALFDVLAHRVEGTLLAELSRPPAHVAPRSTPLDRLVLVTFVPLDAAYERALTAFGFTSVEVDSERALLPRVRGEASRVGLTDVDMPARVYVARACSPATLDVGALEEHLAVEAGAESFGDHPGAPARRLLEGLVALGRPVPDLSRHGLDRLEATLFPRVEGHLRWVPALVFQAYCDAVAVHVHQTFDASLEWATSEELEPGLATPPLVRSTRGGEAVHVPLGLELLRFQVLPLAPGEDAPPITEWAEHSFGHRPD